MARHLIDFGKVGFVQIDCGRIGGIGPAKAVADYAAATRSDLRQPYLHVASRPVGLAPALCGSRRPPICEYPVKPRQLAIDLTTNHLELDANGELAFPDAPGLGMDVNPEALAKYRVDVEITVNGKRLFGSRA